MWNQACPLCFAKPPRALILTRTEGLVCPSCHAPLELSRPSKLLSSAVGLLVAYFVFRFARPSGVHPFTGWLIPIVESVFAYAICSALVLVFFSDLVVRRRTCPAAFPHSHS